MIADAARRLLCAWGSHVKDLRLLLMFSTLAGDEGNGGNKGTTTTAPKGSSVSCSANAEATSFSAATSAHVEAILEVELEACSAKTGAESLKAKYEGLWKKAAKAVAEVRHHAYTRS
jgi:hypothetical protein